MNTNITKKGIVNLSTISETFVCPFDTAFYVEPDGSTWIRIAHHNNPSTNKFASTDTFTSSVYKDTNRWFYVSLCNKITNNVYELMVKQTAASGDSEVKYRWIQTKNPMTATFAETTTANVTIISTSGYSTYTNYGGMYYNDGSRSYIVANNAINGNWWGAIGCWTDYSSGIPGYGQTPITTGYIDLYLRVDNQNNDKPSLFKNAIIANHFYEI
jgi:hypothetical protein